SIPVIDEAVPPEQWRLSPPGLEGAATVPALLPAGALLVASTEPKAIQTLEPAGAPQTDARFVEVRRENEPFGGNFRELRLAYVGGADRPDWEPHDEVVARFGDGIADWQRQAGDRALVVASHGMAMTTWLAATVGLPEPAAFWSDLRMPDVFRVDLDAGTVERVAAA
ncbi:MAG TPA: histidine phosphatase family protein, partial [Micromonosporaceae bacterium]